jgi:hypothetical protein
MRDVPVCLCQWYHARRQGGASRLAERALGDIPEEQRAHLRIETVFSRLEFISAIRGWYQTSSNTQCLLLVAHGVQNDAGEWVGIGSTIEDEPVTDEDCIEWAEFWKVVVAAKTKPPGLRLVGCRTAEAVKAFVPPLLTRRDNNPSLIGVTEVVTGKTRRSAYDLAMQLLQNIHNRSLFLDQEVEELQKKFPQARGYYPVVALEDMPPRYVAADQMNDEFGMSFRQYLDHENEWLARRSQHRRRRAGQKRAGGN